MPTRYNTQKPNFARVVKVEERNLGE